MLGRIVLIIILLTAEAGLGYYSLLVSDSLFMRFLFFLLSTAIVCLLVLKGINYILPKEDYTDSDKTE